MQPRERAARVRWPESPGEVVASRCAKYKRSSNGRYAYFSRDDV